MIGIPREDEALFPGHAVRRKGLTIKYVRRMKHTYPRAIQMVADGLIDVDSIVTHCYPIERVAEAYDLVASRADGVMKAVVEVSK